MKRYGINVCETVLKPREKVLYISRGLRQAFKKVGIQRFHLERVLWNTWQNRLYRFYIAFCDETFVLLVFNLYNPRNRMIHNVHISMQEVFFYQAPRCYTIWTIHSIVSFKQPLCCVMPTFSNMSNSNKLVKNGFPWFFGTSVSLQMKN